MGQTSGHLCTTGRLSFLSVLQSMSSQPRDACRSTAPFRLLDSEVFLLLDLRNVHVHPDDERTSGCLGLAGDHRSAS